MTAPTDGEQLLQRAETVFSSFVRRREAGEEVDFERLCSENRDLEEFLRLLHLTYFVGSPVAGSEPFRGLLRERLGDEALDTLSLHLDARSRAGATETLTRRSDDGEPRYVIEDEIGRGGMSVILRVLDRDFDRRLAMKVLTSEAGTSGGTITSFDRLQQFLEEAQITAQLDHPGIVPVHDCGVDEEGRVYFTMRLVRGKDFREIIELAREQRDGWNLVRAVGVIVKVCQAVAYGHAKGVVHRDLKPANIMVGAFGETYVMDWGLAQRLGRRDRYVARMRFSPDVTLTTVHAYRDKDGAAADDEDPGGEVCTLEGTVVGTPVYMSPEQAEGRIEDVDRASDVYSLGAVLYHLLTGQLPYVTPGAKLSPLVVLGRVLEFAPDPVREIDPDASPELTAICERAMSRAKKDRYRDSLELAEELQAFLERGVERSDGARSRRHRLPAIVGAIALLGLVAIAVAALVYGVGDRDRVDSSVRTYADLYRLGELEREAAALWPASHAKAAAMEDWLRRANAWRAIENLDPVAQPLRDRLPRFDDTLASVEKRLEFARTVRKKTIVDAWDDWQGARDSIEESAEYAGLVVEPQEGLLPLGRDPDSGLWEFGHLQTGRIPSRDENGALQLDEETGLVFVLVPPTRFAAAFFLSKYEMTQGQWRRFTGANPATHRQPPLQPVETVSWRDCDDVLRRLGLALPTEAQWNRAAAGGRRPGPPREETAGSDGQVRPVDTTEPNAFGLCGLRDNVREWCEDGFREPSDPGEPLAPGPEAFRGRVIRGGSYRSSTETPLEDREFAGADYRAPDLGVRPARALD